MASTQLPTEFRDLQPFADEWSLETELKRQAKRKASDMQDLERFYDAIFPRMDAIMAYLDQRPLAQIAGEDANLLWLTLSFAEIAPAVDLFRQPLVPDGFEPDRFVPVAIDRLAPVEVRKG
jgi:hypothetical protein